MVRRKKSNFKIERVIYITVIVALLLIMSQCTVSCDPLWGDDTPVQEEDEGQPLEEDYVPTEPAYTCGAPDNEWCGGTCPYDHTCEKVYVGVAGEEYDCLCLNQEGDIHPDWKEDESLLGLFSR